jgi:hypothetical protein
LRLRFIFPGLWLVVVVVVGQAEGGLGVAGEGVSHLVLVLLLGALAGRREGRRDLLDLLGAALFAHPVHGFQDGPADGEGEGAFQYVADVDVHGGGGIYVSGGIIHAKNDETELDSPVSTCEALYSLTLQLLS